MTAATLLSVACCSWGHIAQTLPSLTTLVLHMPKPKMSDGATLRGGREDAPCHYSQDLCLQYAQEWPQRKEDELGPHHCFATLLPGWAQKGRKYFLCSNYDIKRLDVMIHKWTQEVPSSPVPYISKRLLNGDSLSCLCTLLIYYINTTTKMPTFI